MTGETPNPLVILREARRLMIPPEVMSSGEVSLSRSFDAALAQVEALAGWAHEALATLRDIGCQDAPFVCEFITNDEGCAVCELLQREAALVPFVKEGA